MAPTGGGQDGSGGASYGSSPGPTDRGSGGASVSSNSGGAGGGRIQSAVTDALALDGEVSMDDFARLRPAFGMRRQYATPGVPRKVRCSNERRSCHGEDRPGQATIPVAVEGTKKSMPGKEKTLRALYESAGKNMRDHRGGHDAAVGCSALRHTTFHASPAPALGATIGAAVWSHTRAEGAARHPSTARLHWPTVARAMP